MLKKEFWTIINSTLDAKNREEQITIIQNELRKLNETELVSFYQTLTEINDDAICGQIWGAGLILNGSSFLFGPQEEFDNFIYWLISKGESVYNNALKNPDSLASVISQRDIDDKFEFEDLRYIPLGIHLEIFDSCLLNKLPEKEELDEEEAREEYFKKMGKGWDYTNINEMFLLYPNLMKGFLDCYLSFQTPVEKKIGWVEINNNIVRSEDILNVQVHIHVCMRNLNKGITEENCETVNLTEMI